MSDDTQTFIDDSYKCTSSSAVRCFFQLFVLSITLLKRRPIASEESHTANANAISQPFDLKASLRLSISWINSPSGREPLPLWFSRWHYLQMSCPLKLVPSKYFTRWCQCQHVQPLNYVSDHETSVFVAFTQEAVKFLFRPITHLKMLVFILFPGGGL